MVRRWSALPDRDGDLEIAGAIRYWESASDGYYLYRNETNNSAWLVVQADAGPKNPFGVGAKVSVFDGSTLLGFRQIIIFASGFELGTTSAWQDTAF